MQNSFKDREAAEKLGQYAESAIDEGEKKAKSAVYETQKKFKQGQEQLTQLVSGVDEQVHTNPWPVIAGVAVGCLFLGFILGSKTRS